MSQNNEDRVLLQSHIEENSKLKEKVALQEQNYKLLLQELQSIKSAIQLGSARQGDNCPTDDTPQKVSLLDGEGKLVPAAALQRISDIEQKVLDSTMEMKKVSNTLDYFAEWLRDLTFKINAQDQRGRLNNLLLHKMLDVPLDKKGYDFTKWVTTELNKLFPASVLGFSILESHIETSHPLYKNGHYNGVVIVRFTSRDVRNQIFFTKKNLKLIGSRVVVTEHLTPATIALLDYAAQALGSSNTWTSQTKVFVKVDGFKGKRVVKCKEDIDYITNFLQKNPEHSTTVGTLEGQDQPLISNLFPSNTEYPTVQQAAHFHNLNKRQREYYSNHNLIF